MDLAFERFLVGPCPFETVLTSGIQGWRPAWPRAVSPALARGRGGKLRPTPSHIRKLTKGSRANDSPFRTDPILSMPFTLVESKTLLPGRQGTAFTLAGPSFTR